MAAEDLEFRRLNVFPFIDRADDVACYGAYHNDVAKIAAGRTRNFMAAPFSLTYL